MDSYLVKLINSSEFWITGEEYQAIMKNDGLITIRRLGRTINKTSISEIIPQDQYEFEKNPDSGVLHDGTKVVRYFGSYYLEGEVSDTGKPCKVIDPEHYPEVQRDCVPSPAEYYTKYAHLPREKRLALMIKGRERGESEFKKIEFNKFKALT